MTGDLLASERAFFDREASELTEEELLVPTPRDVERFRNAKPSWRNMAKDALFARIMPLGGKRVLDYGSGQGENACLLASCGAHVTAFDLSPISIEQARKRAKLHDLQGHIQFDVRTAGSTGYPDASFDVVAAFAILHHLHTMLPTVYEEIHRVLRPGGTAAFIEPVANSRLLALLRRLTPVPCYATPDERQLTYGDFASMRPLFRDIRMVHFDGLARLRRLTGQRGIKPLLWADYWMQRVLPPLKRLYGSVVLTARR